MSATSERAPKIPARGVKSEEPDSDDGVRPRRSRQVSLDEFDFIRQTGRAIDDMGMKLRAITKARVHVSNQSASCCF